MCPPAQVKCDTKLIPEPLKDWTPDQAKGAPPVIDQLVEALRPFDDELAKEVEAKAEAGLVPVHVGCVDVDADEASVELRWLPRDALFTRCEQNENLVAISSQRYSPRPLVLQGYGAGAEITASGLFSDLLHLSRSLVEWGIPLGRTSGA